MTVEEALAKAEEQLSHCIYLSETSTKPGIVKINSNKAKWLSVLLFYAKKGLRYHQEPKWIPVTKRLPESEKDPVLIALKWGSVDIGWCENERWGSEFVIEYYNGEVTHWMPLPEQPHENITHQSQ